MSNLKFQIFSIISRLLNFLLRDFIPETPFKISRLVFYLKVSGIICCGKSISKLKSKYNWSLVCKSVDL